MRPFSMWEMAKFMKEFESVENVKVQGQKPKLLKYLITENHVKKDLIIRKKI